MATRTPIAEPAIHHRNNGSQRQLPDISWEFVTPAMATQYLALSTGNRSEKYQHMKRLCRDASAGRFHVTHHAIAFDDFGVFIDGHHRMRMIIETGIGQWLIVVRGVPRAGLAYIDGGVPRSIRDAMQIISKDGKAPKNEAISVAMAVELYPRLQSFHYSRDEVASILEALAEEIDKACMFRCKGFTKGIRTTIVRALLARPEDEARILDFGRIIVDGLVSDPDEDMAAIRMRNYMLSLIGQSGNQLERLKYKKASAALDHFLNKRPIDRIYGTEQDLFPLPKWWKRIYGGEDSENRESL